MKNILRKKILFGQFIIVALLAGTAIEGVTMSLFSKEKEEVVLFSEMKGRITLNGDSVKGAKIERWIKWKDDDGEKDFFITDDKGEFYLPEVNVNTSLPKFSQFVVTQELVVEYKGKKYSIWNMGKLTKERFGELGGAPVNLSCDLNDEPTRVEIDNGLLGTSCKWEAISK